MSKSPRILEQIKDGSFLGNEAFKGVDADAILNGRDEADFERQWLDAWNTTQEAWRQFPIAEEFNVDIDQAREAAFKRVFQATRHHELASQSADDLELVCKAALVGFQSEFVQWLERAIPKTPCRANLGKGMMANFRCERVFIMLDEPVPGLNHLKAIVPEDFATSLIFSEQMDNQAIDAGLTPLTKFLFAPFERPKWQPAFKGLETIRGLIELYNQWQQSGHNPIAVDNSGLASEIEILRQVESVLDAADTLDRRFYFASKDLA